MKADLTLFFQKFHNQKPTKEEAIAAYDEFINLQKSNQPIPKDLQAFINYEVIRLKTTHENGTQKTLNLYTTPSNERKNGNNSFSKQIYPIIIYYLFYVSSSFQNIKHLTKRRKEIAIFLREIKISKSICSQEQIKKIVDKFELYISHILNNKSRLEACELFYTLFLANTLEEHCESFRKFDLYDCTFKLMNFIFHKYNQPQLSSVEMQHIMKDSLSTNSEKNKATTHYINQFKKINSIKKMANEIYTENCANENDTYSEKQAKIEYIDLIITQALPNDYMESDDSKKEPELTLEELEILNNKYTIF